MMAHQDISIISGMINKVYHKLRILGEIDNRGEIDNGKKIAPNKKFGEWLFNFRVYSTFL